VSKLLAFALWQLRRLFAAISNDGLAEWKALVVLGCSEMAAVMLVFFGISIAIGHKLLVNSDLPFYLAAVVGLGLSYFSFRKKSTWTRFETEFRSYSAVARVLGAMVVIIVIVSIAVAALFSAAAAHRLPG
jgi:hypothetical protein